jgi:transmembrane sensor
MTPQQRASFLELVDKYLAGTATAEERAVVEQYDALFADAPDALDNLNTEQLGRLEHQLKVKIKARIRKAESPAVPLYRRWKGIGPVPAIWKVAAAVAAITLGTWMYYASGIGGSSSRGIEGSLVYATDIAPGKQGATITLASGKVIKLSDAKSGVVISDELTYDDGTAIPSSLRDEVKQSQHAMVTANTTRGQTYQFTLPDGTRVWLNADSKISFPSQFIGAQRKIILSGEAYFEVSHNKLKPFVVQTGKQEVTVLGTHFNINSYADEGSTKTTLLEGSVQVTSSSLLTSPSLRGKRSDEAISKGAAVYLKPGQQSIITDNNHIKIQPANIEEAIAWKEGNFVFEDESLRSIMRKLARWYDIEVVYDGGIGDAGYTGVISRNKNISQVLEILERSKEIRFKIEGRRVIVKN